MGRPSNIVRKEGVAVAYVAVAVAYWEWTCGHAGPYVKYCVVSFSLPCVGLTHPCRGHVLVRFGVLYPRS